MVFFTCANNSRKGQVAQGGVRMYGMSVFALVAGFVIVICILKMQIRQAGLTHRFCLVAVVFATVATAIWLPVPTAAAAVGLVVGIIGGYLLFWWGGKDLD